MKFAGNHKHPKRKQFGRFHQFRINSEIFIKKINFVVLLLVFLKVKCSYILKIIRQISLKMYFSDNFNIPLYVKTKNI